MHTNKGRRYHLWPAGERQPDGTLLVRCSNCGLGSRVLDDVVYRVEFTDSRGRLLTFDEVHPNRVPECPKEPTW